MIHEYRGIDIWKRHGFTTLSLVPINLATIYGIVVY